MRLLLAAALLLTLPASANAQRQWSRYPSAREVQLRDIAALVRVTPENREDVAVFIENTGSLPEMRVRRSGARLIVDGRLRGQIRSCAADPEGEFAVTTRRAGRVEGAALPIINLRVPQNAVVAAGGAFRIAFAPARSARISLDGCGDADVERVEEGVEAFVSGSPHVRVWEAGTAEVSVAGEGEVTLGAIRHGLTASLAGDGVLNVTRADGPISLALQGDGEARIHSGRADALNVAIFGAGRVEFGGAAQSLDAAIFGDGSVRVTRVEGQINRRVFGGGTVTIGQ